MYQTAPGIYLIIYFNVHIVVGYYYCVGIPRWVLDHLLGYVWEVPLGGRNPIPPTHLEILLLLVFIIVLVSLDGYWIMS